MYKNEFECLIKEKEIIIDSELLEKLENPVSQSLYIYLEQARPRNIRIADFEESIFKEKSAGCRILMILATIELEKLGYLRDSIHRNDSIEFIYA